jgi:hypothetical protein
VRDAEWIALLLAHGLVAPSFVRAARGSSSCAT